MGPARDCIRRVRRRKVYTIVFCTLCVVSIILTVQSIFSEHLQNQKLDGHIFVKDWKFEIQKPDEWSKDDEIVFDNDKDEKYDGHSDHSFPLIHHPPAQLNDYRLSNNISTNKQLEDVFQRLKLQLYATDQALVAQAEENFRKGVKYLIVLGHYEQLGKTTVNFFEASALASSLKRSIVQPFVKNSRFCGLPAGWFGSARKNTRLFLPLSLYFDETDFRNVMKQGNISNMVELNEFIQNCSFLKHKRQVVIVYFIYDGGAEDSKKYLYLSDKEYELLVMKLNSSSGWIDCSFINEKLKIEERFSGIEIGNQYCVDPNKITSTTTLEQDILKKESCVIFHYWKGRGVQRTNFDITLRTEPQSLLKHLSPSSLIVDEVRRFFVSREMSTFIGIHIRSERQLLWYGFNKFKKCISLLGRVIKDLQTRTNISNVFISADVDDYGSDQFSPNFNSSQMEKIRAQYRKLINKLKATTYTVRKIRNPVWTDTGLVALVQMNILSQASHLVTMGAGTFQQWIINYFKEQKLKIKDKSWTITRACYKESKAKQGRSF